MEHFLTTILEERPMIGLLLAFTVLALLSCIPFLPIPLVVGMIATQFEWYVAWAVSITGNVFGSIVMFVLMRYFFRSYAQRQLAKHTYGTYVEKMMTKHGFFAVLIGRLIPIMPSAAINGIASITGVSLIAFCSATIIGKAPNMFVYAAAGSELQHNPVLISVFVAVYIVLLFWMARLVKKKLPQL